MKVLGGTVGKFMLTIQVLRRKRSKSLRNRNTETLSKGRCRLKREETDMKETKNVNADAKDVSTIGTDDNIRGDSYGTD
jgi:hypothetical protein